MFASIQELDPFKHLLCPLYIEGGTAAGQQQGCGSVWRLTGSGSNNREWKNRSRIGSDRTENPDTDLYPTLRSGSDISENPNPNPNNFFLLSKSRGIRIYSSCQSHIREATRKAKKLIAQVRARTQCKGFWDKPVYSISRSHSKTTISTLPGSGQSPPGSATLT